MGLWLGSGLQAGNAGFLPSTPSKTCLCPITAQKPLRKASLLQEAAKMVPKCVPLIRSRGGGGFAHCLDALSSLPSGILHGFPHAQNLKMGPRLPKHLENTAQSASKSLPKTILE